MAISVHPAGPDDFDAWFALFEAVAAEGIWIGREAPLDRDDRKCAFDDQLADPATMLFVAEVDGHLAGTISVSLRIGIADFGMMVDSRYRGSGIGSALLEACIGWAREQGAHKIKLEMWPHNRAALALYEKFGFGIEGTLRRHYRRRNGELWDAVIMGLVLDEDAPASPHGTGV